jgi:putative ABC transport system permease protein
MALQSLKAARWRSRLTMLGIIIGIVSVVTIVSLGEGIKAQVSGQINRLGQTLLTIRPGVVNPSTKATLHSLTNLIGPSDNSVLTSNDFQVVSKTPGVAVAVPLGVVPGTVSVSGELAGTNPVVIATTSGLPSMLQQSVQYGQFFTPGDYSQNVAVISSNLAMALFQTNVPLGQFFTFHGQQFMVDGVMDAFNTPPLSLDIDFNNAIFIPYPIATQLEQNNAPLYEILTKPTSSQKTTNVQQAITSRLQAAHGGTRDFSVLTQRQTLAVTGSVLNLLTSLISGIAAISLLVGGVGIMNVMLVSVTERTREIGIRKAIGATNRQIRAQFLTEAAVLSLIGGVAAVIISLLINVGIRATTDLAPALSWQVMVLSTAVAVMVGITFGLAPAVKAARRDPITALRHE